MDSWRRNIPLIGSGFCEELLKKTENLRKTRTIYPPEDKVLYALKSLPFQKVKVVILGQDPYHGPGQANGLAFSVPEGVKPPPSLKNIFRELLDDLSPGKEKIIGGLSTDLSPWAKQGVLLLNTSLTVEEKKPGSHKNKGWEKITDQIIQSLSEQKKNLVFILWGAFAASKKNLIDPSSHLILEAPHPSPLSAYRGFFGCRHFSKTNQYLSQNGTETINWLIRR